MAPRDSDRGRSFRYQARSRDDLRERATQKSGNFDTIIKPKYKTFKPRDGKNLIRVLPPTWKDAKHYGYDIWVNYNVGVDNQSYLSLSEMKNEQDPLAEARRKAEKEQDKEFADQLKPKKRIVMWVVDRMAEDEGPLLWASPWTLDKDLANISFDEDTKEVVFIDDPENGCDVRFYKEGTGRNTTYDASKMRIMKPSVLHEDQAVEKDWLDFIQDNQVPDCLQFYDYDHIAAVFGGQSSKPKDEDEDKPQPRTRPAPRDEEVNEKTGEITERRGRSRVDPEDDETPVRPAPRRAVAPADEDEDKPASSIRDRLRARRTQEVPSDED